MNIYINRKKKFLENIEKNSITLVFGNRKKYRNSDITYRFRQNSNYLYLIGLNEPDSISIIEKHSCKHATTTIFSHKKNKKNKIWDDNILGQNNIINKFNADYFLLQNLKKE